MANELILTYGYAGKTITAKVFRGNPLTQAGDTVTLSEDIAYIYVGDVSGTALQDGDLIVYYDTEIPIGSEIYHPEVKVSNPDDCKADVSLLALEATVQSLLAVLPITDLPSPSISMTTIKIILQLHDDTYDNQLAILIPIIEDIVCQYCGASSINQLSVGVIFPLAGLIRYAMENPIGAKAQTVGGDRTEYGEFPNALLKLLKYFRPGTTAGLDDPESINLQEINRGLYR